MGSMKLWIIGGVFVVLTGVSFLSIHARNSNGKYQAQVGSQVNQENWTLIWSDEFDGEALDTEKWTGVGVIMRGNVIQLALKM